MGRHTQTHSLTALSRLSLPSVDSSFPPSAGYLTLMAIVMNQLNMTLAASRPRLSANPQWHAQGSQCEGCSSPFSLSASLDFSKLTALTPCSRASMLSGLKESYFPNTCLSFYCFPHGSESVISSCVLYNMPDLASGSAILKVWTSGAATSHHLHVVRNAHGWGPPRPNKSEPLKSGPASWVLRTAKD